MRVRFPSPIPSSVRRCRTAVSSLGFQSSYAGANPATDSTLSPFTLRSASGEAMTISTNPALVHSLGANERWVRLPPLRLHFRHCSKDGTQPCEGCWLRFKSSRWHYTRAAEVSLPRTVNPLTQAVDTRSFATRPRVSCLRAADVRDRLMTTELGARSLRTSLSCPLSQSVLGTAAAHSRVRDGSIPSAATTRVTPRSQCLWFEASSLGEKDKSSFDSRVRFPSVAPLEVV